MAKKKRRKAGKKPSGGMPGWVHMLGGLAIGLTVAYGIYVSDRRNPPAAAPVAEITEPARATPPPVAEVMQKQPEDAVTFDFYDMLPNLDVDLYENAGAPPVTPQAAPDAPPSTAPAATPVPAPAVRRAEVARIVEKPGIYILQAGSFSTLADAQRRKAEIGLLGVHSEIKRGDVNGRNYYRVYTDPMDQPEDVNRVSTLLSGAGIDILMKRVSD